MSSDCGTFCLTYPFTLVLSLLAAALRLIISSEPPSPFDNAYALRNMCVSSGLWGMISTPSTQVQG